MGGMHITQTFSKKTWKGVPIPHFPIRGNFKLLILENLLQNPRAPAGGYQKRALWEIFP